MKPQNNFFKFEPALYDNRYAVLIVDKKSNRKEAEKAVEKLRVWKRLKDKGYYFKEWRVVKSHLEIELHVKEYDFVNDELKHDLDLLFGGEDD